jgi:hypothetical protein
MYGIEFFVRVVARKLCVVVGHFIVAGASVLGFQSCLKGSSREQRKQRKGYT